MKKTTIRKKANSRKKGTKLRYLSKQIKKNSKQKVEVSGTML